jgi:transposase
MEKLTTHYQQLLGLPETWWVEDVNFSPTEMKVSIYIKYVGTSITCPECGAKGTIHDYSPEQRWRHLDTMQFETIIEARVPRCRCKGCGVKTVAVPWAERHSRFTLLFEAVAVMVLQNSANITSASAILKLDWHAAADIMRRAVERGLARREDEEIPAIGIDEKSFRAGHKYVINLTDIKGSRVLDVREDRTVESTESLLNTLTDKQKSAVKSVSVDMWKPFQTAVENTIPDAAIVHDKFHISCYLGDSVDKVRRAESGKQRKAGDYTLLGSKHLWLRNPENMTDKQFEKFVDLMQIELNTGVAWSLKNTFRSFWKCTSVEDAMQFFAHWAESVDLSGLKPVIKVKNMLVRHLSNILNYFVYRVTNGVTEGINSKIQMVKAAARGFHTFSSYRTRILFYCGRLDMSPIVNHEILR